MTKPNLYHDVYKRFATNFSVYDGDSLKCDLDEGDYRWEYQRPLRLFGVDTPELAPLWDPHYGGAEGKLDPEQIEARGREKAAAREARDRCSAYIHAATNVIVVQTIKLPKRKVRDKYGRTLARIFIPIGAVMLDLAELLLLEKHARPYTGGRKTKWATLRQLGQLDPEPVRVAELAAREA